jgi:hypothetical protein
MLFILNSQGVPSVARIVQIGGGAAPPPPNPPTLSSMSPTSVAAGSGAFTLTVNGTNFVAGSTVQWNGAARATTFVSATQLTASIGASDVAAAGSATVTVINPSGGGTSNGLTFTISGGGLQVWITQPTPGATVSGTAWATVWLDGTSGASNALNATLDGRAAGSTTSSSAGPISFTFDTTVVSDGTHTLTVAARDAVGHTGTNGISIQTNNGISAPPPPPPPPPPGWTFCANENQTCTFAGTKLVRYGANGTYVQQTATNSIGCNNATFGDPLPGVVKHCDYTDAPSTSTWTFCANEDQTCTFSGTKLVRYGANGTYVQQTATNSISCNNATFGDPLVGVVKHCDYTDAPPTSTWTFCANENQTCTFAGTKIVRYGANGTYVQQTATTSISCNNATFGDPLVGTFKHCDYTDTANP